MPTTKDNKEDMDRPRLLTSQYKDLAHNLRTSTPFHEYLLGRRMGEACRYT